MTINEKIIYPPKGYKAAGLHCGLKEGDDKDLALIVSDRAASAAGMFTTNRVCAAPVHLNREHLQNGRARAVVVNSKNANACTGDQGMADARQMAQWVGSGLDVVPEDVLVNSTGVIGVPLPMGCLEAGIRNIIPQLSVEGWDDAAEGIMTTDTVPKKASVRCEIDGCEITIAGIAKGAGMIAPNMATMLAFVLTDAALSPGVLQDALCEAVTQSFNCITVDGDMSTNDTVLALANGAARKSELSGEDLLVPSRLRLMQFALVWPNKLLAMARGRPNLLLCALMVLLPRQMRARWGCLSPTQISSRPLFLDAIPTGAAFCVRWVMPAWRWIPTAQPF